MLTCSVAVLFTFYLQGVLKLKKIIPAPKGKTEQVRANNLVTHILGHPVGMSIGKTFGVFYRPPDNIV